MDQSQVLLDWKQLHPQTCIGIKAAWGDRVGYQAQVTAVLQATWTATTMHASSAPPYARHD